MNGGYFFVNNIRPAFVQFIYDVGDGFLISGDEFGREDNGILFFYLYLPMISGGHSRKGGHGFALTAGGNNDDFIIGIGVDFADIDFHTLRQRDIAEPFCNFYTDFNASSVKNDFPLPILGDVDNLLNPRDVGSKQ